MTIDLLLTLMNDTDIEKNWLISIEYMFFSLNDFLSLNFYNRYVIINDHRLPIVIYINIKQISSINIEIFLISKYFLEKNSIIFYCIKTSNNIIWKIETVLLVLWLMNSDLGCFLCDVIVNHCPFGLIQLRYSFPLYLIMSFLLIS